MERKVSENENKREEMVVNTYKKQIIGTLKTIDKNEVFKEKEKPKLTFFEKIKRMFGYGKER